MTVQFPPPSQIEPDWSAQSEKVPCPLCDYDLRGLHEPRCPECGYQFHWPDLLDPARRLHPFVFEHYPRRNIWSFRKTSFATSFRPKKFWSSLLPSQPSVPRRLILYWAIHAILLALFFLAFYSYFCTQLYAQQSQQRAQIQLWMKQYPAEYRIEIQRWGSKEAFVDSQAPLPPSWSFFWLTFRAMPICRMMAEWTVVLIMWPWLATVSLMTYRASMRQAKLRSIHLLRAAIYSGGVSIAAIGAITFAILLSAPLAVPNLDLYWLWDYASTMAWVVMFMTLTYRLSRAYRYYMGFHHALIAVALSQIVVLLALAQTVLSVFGYEALRELVVLR
jgi:hypothetical protein